FSTLYSLMLVQEIRAAGHQVDLGKVLEKATLHDVDESIFGDIPRVTKYFSPGISAEFKKIEREGVEQLFKQLKLEKLADVWKEAKDSSLEGQIVAVVDLAAVVFKVWSEIALYGNMSFLRVYR